MTLDDSEFTVARGFPMNGQGRKMVTHPDTGKLVGYWGASDWPLDPPYTGPPDAGDKGTYVHNLVYWQLGAIPADGLKARREELDIPAEVARHIAEGWQRFADEHVIVVHHVEHPSVNDRYEIASPIDIVGTVGGQPAIVDVKTGSVYAKTSYAVQMVYYAGSVRYVDGERSEWFDYASRVETFTEHDGWSPAAYLAHYPLSAALKAHAAGDPLPRWELHPVDVEAARPWADMLHTLRRARPAVAFPGRADVVDKIAAPDERTANVSTVEQPAGGDPPASPAKPLDNSKSYDVDRFGRPVLPPADEGDDADPQAVAVLKARYAALEGDGKAWVNAVAKQAQAAGGALSLADSQPQSIRRFEAMRGLVLLAEGGFADDAGVRGILRPILGDVADMMAFSVGKLVAHLTPAEAARFASLAEQVVDGAVSLAVKADGRYEWEFAA
jgi:hypothetical protein